MFGCAAAEAIGQSIARFIPERFGTAHSDDVRRFGQTGVTNRAMGSLDSLWAVRANGEEFPIEATISQVENAGKKLFTVIIRDATERRRAELAVAESEKRFRLIANTAPVLIWMSDPDKSCSYFNQSWLEFTGRRLEQELGNGWIESVHSQDLQGCLHTYTQFFDRRERFRMEYRLRRHDGEYRWVLDIGVPRFNGDGSFAGYVGCCMDISDLKRAKATVTEFSGRLLRAGEDERARIARELHDDINQRLALLANGLQEIEQASSTDKNPSRRHGLHSLWQLTNEIANDIQHMSHQLHPSKLHYLGLATTVRQLCNEFAQQHKIDIECIVKELPSDLDENVSLNLFRMVQESLRNVAKHSHARHVKVEFTCQSDIVHLGISDDGVGFDTENPRVNHGLGLVSLRERLRAIGGEFSIWSKPSLGTLVEGKVPAVTKPASSKLTVVDATGTE
jgi:PAS domain S-box-containing protein